MSSYKYIQLRDCPHEFIITIGGGIKLERTWWEKLIHPVSPKSTDLELFFQFDIKEWKELDVKGLTLVHYRHFDSADITMEDLAVALEQLPSKSQARKNGWAGPIPDGYSEFKRKFHKFYLLKIR